jgi:hypothetical protein
LAKLYIDPSNLIVRYDPTADNSRAKAASEAPYYMVRFVDLAEPFVLDELRRAYALREDLLPLVELLLKLRRTRAKYAAFL